MKIIKKIIAKNRIKREMNDVLAIKQLVLAHLHELIKRRKEIDENLFEVTAFLLDEIGDALDAIITLKKDHLKSSIMISRYILENCVNLQYIYKQDAEKRAFNYRAFSAKELLNRAEMYEGGDERIKKEIPRIKERAEKHSPSGKNSNHWDGLSTKKIMSDLNLEGIYQIWYVRMSSYIHPQYRGGKIEADDKGEYIDFLKKMVFKDLNLPILESLRAINKKFDLLEGVVIISNYPKEKATLVFSINERREPKRP